MCPLQPCSVDYLPLIAKLARAAHHRYRRRWTKRFAKKPVRWIFEFAYGVLKLGGSASVTLQTENGDLRAFFDARKTHFGNLYFGHDAAGYEPDVSALLSSLLTDNRTFFDIGANWGYFTFYAVAIPHYHGLIHSFEPVPATRGDLQGLVDGFGLQQRVTVHGVALSSSAGTAVMAVHDKETGLNRITGSGVGREGSDKVDVPMIRMDDLGLSPDVIKMDVEDHEFEALSGARVTLEKSRPFIIVESWLTLEKPQRTLRALRLLEQSGYLLFQPCWSIRMDGDVAIFPNPGQHMPGPDCRLALVQFRSEQRFMLATQMNVFACHASRVDELEADGFKVMGGADESG